VNWSDDDDLWEALMPALASPQREAIADADVVAIASAVPLQPGARVLDLGCGAGFHAVAFAARGCDVTGVDRTATLLRVAEANAAARSVKIAFINADMRDFVRPASFDLVCSLYSSFGYFDDDANRRVLMNVRTSLDRGGVLVLDLIGTWQPAASAEVDGVSYSVQRELRDHTLVETWTIGAKQFVVTQRIYGGAELTDLLDDVGFADVDLASSLDGTARYDAASPRLVAFAS
jgi:SAM-dependent methyltransferase